MARFRSSRNQVVRSRAVLIPSESRQLKRIAMNGANEVGEREMAEAVAASRRPPIEQRPAARRQRTSKLSASKATAGPLMPPTGHTRQMAGESSPASGPSRSEQKGKSQSDAGPNQSTSKSSLTPTASGSANRKAMMTNLKSQLGDIKTRERLMKVVFRTDLRLELFNPPERYPIESLLDNLVSLYNERTPVCHPRMRRSSLFLTNDSVTTPVNEWILEHQYYGRLPLGKSSSCR